MLKECSAGPVDHCSKTGAYIRGKPRRLDSVGYCESTLSQIISIYDMKTAFTPSALISH